MAMERRRVVPHAAAGLATAAILVATLIPTGSLVTGSQGPQWEGEPFPLADLLRNLILFAPLGASLAWSGLRFHRALTLLALLSAGIELAQGALPIAGRDPSAIDWIGNVAGAGLAIALFRAAPAWLRPSERRARRLAVAAGALAVAVLIGTGLLLTPAPTAAVYFGHHTPSLGHLAPYAGTVLDAAIDDIEIPVGRLSASDRIRARLEGDYALHVRERSGTPPPYLAGLLLITDAAQNEILLLGPDRDDLVYRFRSRSQALGLETATVRLPGVLGQIRPGNALELRVERSGADLCIAVDRAANCGYGFTVGDGWRLLAPDYRILARWHPALGAAWIAALFLPLGYWGRGGAVNAAAWVGAASALLLVPVVSPLRPTPLSQIAGAGFAAVLGMAARRQLALLPDPSERRP